MAEFWETNFRDKQMMWGDQPAISSIFARDYFLKKGIKDVLIPGIGYGRNAQPFLDVGMRVTGIEISQTAIDLVRGMLKSDIPIFHGSVCEMPFEITVYDGIYCHALIHLLDVDQREKFIKNCYAQLAVGGYMIITAISTKSPTYGNGIQISAQRYEQFGGVQIFFYDDAAIHREFDSYGLVEIRESSEPNGGSQVPEMKFLTAVCKKHG